MAEIKMKGQRSDRTPEFEIGGDVMGHHGALAGPVRAETAAPGRTEKEQQHGGIGQRGCGE